jgi:hypothetical protein
MLMRDSDHREQLKRLEGKLEVQEVYTKDMRERQIRMEEQQKKEFSRN